MQQILRTGDNVPVLPDPDADEAQAIGVLAGGSALEVIEVVNHDNKRYATLALTAGGVQLLRSADQVPTTGYVGGEYFVGGLEPATPSSDTRIGVCVIYSREHAMTAARAGCRLFNIVAHAELCSEIMDAYPDATVICRPYVDILGAMPSIDYMMNKLNGARDPRLIYTGLNEGEQIGQGANAIATRGQFDVEMANRIKLASGARYAAGSFSMGEPDITNPSVCAALQQCYAPHYNGGLFWLDQHTYSSNMEHIYREDTQTIDWNGQTQVIVEHEWLETRWHFYFTRCGFNPTSSSRIISLETGVDEGGVGGFPAHHATSQDVVSWCERYRTLSGQPITVSGTQYPSPFAGGALFQYGDSIAWAGFNVANYHDALQNQVWLKRKVFLPRV